MVNAAASAAEARRKAEAAKATQTQKTQAERQSERAAAEKVATQEEITAQVTGKANSKTVNTANTLGTPAEGVMPGNGGGFNVTVMGDCNCEFSQTIVNVNGDYVEVNGDNNQVVQGTGSNIKAEGNNNTIGVTHGDDSAVNQATGKNSQIHQATIKYLDDLKISDENKERLQKQDENTQANLKDNMTSLRSIAFLESAKAQGAEMNDEILAEADQKRFPDKLEDLIADGSEFRKLPPETQKALLESGLPPAAIGDIVDARYTGGVKFDKENNTLKIANFENGIMLTIKTSNEKFTQNMQLGNEYIPYKDQNGVNKLRCKLLIDGAEYKAQYGFDPIKEFGINNGGMHELTGMPTQIVNGERAKVDDEVIINRNLNDTFTFAQTKSSNYLKNEQPTHITSTFNVTYTENARPKMNNFLGTPASLKSLNDGDKVTYLNWGNGVNRLTINDDKNTKVTTASNYI